jgi:hypothetical protein
MSGHSHPAASRKPEGVRINIIGIALVNLVKRDHQGSLLTLHIEAEKVTIIRNWIRIHSTS